MEGCGGQGLHLVISDANIHLSSVITDGSFRLIRCKVGWPQVQATVSHERASALDFREDHVYYVKV